MKGKYSDIYAMMRALQSPLDSEELKAALCEGASNGRTNSLRELTEEELESLRTRLQRETASKPLRGSHSRKRKRSAVLRLLTDYGVDTKDWQAINAFLSQKRIAGKEFAKLTDSELETLRRKLWAMLRKQKQGEQKERKVEKREPQKKLTLYVMNRGSNNQPKYN